MIKRSFNPHDEQGWALVTAVAMMSIMLVIGLATLASVDFNSGQNRQVREREASLNLAEGVLYSQAFTLARKWPNRSAVLSADATTATSAKFPGICTSSVVLTGVDVGKCPNRDNLEVTNSQAKAGAAFTSNEFVAKAKWTTRVRDNYGQLAATYDPAFAGETVTLTQGGVNCPQVPCAFDFNDDKAMWVESRSEVRGKARKVVALMKLEMIQESVPRVGIASGALALTNNGAASYDVTGATATVICPPDPPSPSSSGTCTNYKSANQVKPAPTQSVARNFMTDSQIERFKERAQIDKTYYTGVAGNPGGTCPPLHGQVVFIERLEAMNCDYKGTNHSTVSAPCNPAPPASSGLQNPCVNQLTKPGIVIVRCGGFTTSGNWTFVGVLYFANGSDGSCPTGQVRGTSPPSCPNGSSNNAVIYESSGGAGIWGALAVDGNACVRLGSNSQLQVLFDPNVFNAISSYGTVGLVQNTWRELPAGTN